MKKQAKKAILLGIGLTSLAAKKVNNVTKKLVKDNKINKAQAKKIADKLIKEGVKEEKRIRTKLEAEAKKFLNSLEAASKEEAKKYTKKKTTKKKPKKKSKK